MIFRCAECDETRDGDWEDNLAQAPDGMGIICSRCVEAAEEDMADLEIALADMVYAHAQGASL